MTVFNTIAFKDRNALINLSNFHFKQTIVVLSDDGADEHKIYFVMNPSWGSGTVNDAINAGALISLEDFIQNSSEVNVDNITIEALDFAVKSTGNDLRTAINECWVSGDSSPISTTFRYENFYDGALYGNPKGWWFITTSGETFTLEAGDYEFYAARDISDGTPALEADDATTYNAVLVGIDNGLYRYRITLPSAKNIDAFGFMDIAQYGSPIWFINRFKGNETEVTIKNIDKIIGADGISIDNLGMVATDAKKELVNRDYVEKRIGLVDDITLELKELDLPISGESDFQQWFHNAWDESFPTSNWNLENNSIFSNGEYMLPAGTPLNVGHVKLLSNSSPVVLGHYRYLKFVSNADLNTFELLDETGGVAGTYSVFPETKETLPDGKTLYSVLLPSNFKFTSMQVSFGSGTSSTPYDIYIYLVQMDEYPAKFSSKIKNINYIIDDDNESIDGSDTPATDSHTELVTRAFVESQIADNSLETDDVTIEVNSTAKHSKTENSIPELIINNWKADVSSDVNDWSGSYVSNGVMEVTPEADNYFNFEGDADTEMTEWEEGVYEIYTSINPVENGSDLMLYSHSGNSYTFSFTKENSWYRGTVTIPANEKIVFFGPTSNVHAPLAIVFIDRLNPENESEVTVKEIDHIIGSDLLSVDETQVYSIDPKRELPTLEYVDKKISNADEVTIEKTVGELPIQIDPDVSTILHNAWDDSFDTSYTLGADSSYDDSTGTFTITDSGGIGTPMLLEISSPDTVSRGNFKAITTDSGAKFVVFDGTAGIESYSYNVVNIGNGWYMHDIYVPNGFQVDGIGLAMSVSSAQVKFINMSQYPPRDSFKIKNINYIIDDDNESIDGSDTPATDSHTELVTRAFVESYVGSLAYWVEESSPTGYGDQLRPTNANVKRVEVVNNDRGITEFFVGNYNTSDNYTGSSITLTTDSNNYTQQLFLSMHGDNYYQADLAKRAMIGTDSSLYISAYNSTDRQGQPAFIAFQVGDDYYNRKDIFRLTARGLEMPLAEKKIWYEAGKTVQNHSTNYTQLFTNVDTSEVYAGVPVQLAPVRVIETVNNLDLNGSETIDGISVADGDRVAVTAQTDAKENGIYIVDTGGDWSRSTDLPAGIAVAGKTFVVNEGDSNADTLWEFSNDPGTDVVGTDDLTFKLLASGNLTAGDAITIENGVIRLGGDVVNTSPSIGLGNTNKSLFIDSDYLSDGSQLGVQFYGGDDSNTNHPSILMNILRDWMYNQSDFGLTWTEAWIGFDDGNNPASRIQMSSGGGVLWSRDPNVWNLEESPDGSVAKAIATVEYVTGQVSGGNGTQTSERFILNSTDVSNGYIDLANTPRTDKHLFVFYNGMLLDEDTNGDFILNGNRIEFTSDFQNTVLGEGDKVIVKYTY